jgi:RimJ/RimL family protein N-acetyltransferase
MGARRAVGAIRFDRGMNTDIRIEPWVDDDLELLRRANAPEMTEHLGGPESDQKLLDRHRRYLELRDPAAGRMFRVALLPDGQPVGIVGYWQRVWLDVEVYETGWQVLPEFQGRGIATAAVAAVVAEASEQRTHSHIHAYPSVANAASNAIPRKLGFELAGEYDFEYPPGHIMRCNDWRLALLP